MNTPAQSSPNPLQTCRAFKGVAADVCEQLAGEATLLSFPRSAVIYNEDSAATGVLLVIDGRIKQAIISAEGAEYVVGLLAPGDCVGIAETISQRAGHVTATAIAPVRILRIPRAAFLAQLEANAAFARLMLQCVSDQLYQRTDDFDNFFVRKARARVARFLLELRDQQGHPCPTQIRLPVQKGLIASRLNMTQEHFSRTLRELSQHGAIRVLGQTVHLLEEQALRRLAA